MTRLAARASAIAFAFLVIGLPCSVAPAVAQCCLGAQNSVTHSRDGRFRVEAISLTGTGHGNHGPYKFRFRTLRIAPNGETEEIGVFERAWDTDNHFNMAVCVSPTGNGFALSSSLENLILFFAPNGTVLAKLEEHKPSIKCPCKNNTPIVLTVSGRTQFGPRLTKLWLPLFHVTGPETEWGLGEQPTIKDNVEFKTVRPEEIRWLVRMLKWRPVLGGRQADRVEELIEQSDETGLIDLGLSALPIVEAKLATQEQASLRRVQQEIVRRLCGHLDAWRNFELLVALREHPNSDLRECAKEQLRALLPEGEPTADWVQQNRQHLKWDAKLNVYRR
ncbi:hypothetical protein N9Z44_03625 [Mariniblastus sp.]|nr:hypothetical protein [Mariniblastus sp.]